MKNFGIYMFNPQPEPPPQLGFATPVGVPPEPIALLLPAVQAAR